MEKDFLNAIKLYFDIVEEACELLIEYIQQTEQIVILNKYDLFDYLNTSRKNEFNVKGRIYYCHGNGIRVISNEIITADWDFGCKSWWCGIDPFFMATTLKNAGINDFRHYDGDFIKSKCEQYTQEGFLYLYKNQYYIDLLKFGCQKMDFPNVYDRIAIEYKCLRKEFCRSRIIDRFIKKSDSVYSGISALKNNYIIVFYDNGVEVARIPYNDIAYPEAAVRIMNGEIIKPHIVELWKRQSC